MNTHISQIEADDRFVDMDPKDMRIRRGTTEDANALGRLAQLDGTLFHGGDMLVAESDGELIAAVPMDAGRVFADPFRQTASAVAMLELRRDQLKACALSVARSDSALVRGLRAARRLRPLARASA